ncbi:MAG TPA: ATP-binding protein [Methanomicrobia archaeon]|nr:ATP-binding protein [Methanomicrobia archaeon]
MYMIKDVVTARKEVLEGAFQGVIQTHKIDAKESRLENNPKEFLRITYPSTAIREAVEKINEKLSGKSNQGAFLLVGPYGSGKSHTLITLFHLFNNPQLAKEWGKAWRMDIELPEESRSVIISTRRHDVDHLWEPIFKLLGREDILDKVKRFPTTDQIEEAIGEDTVAIFIDEIENWYGAFDPEKQAHLIEQNETFLEHLLEVAADPNRRLFVFITFLGEKRKLENILERTKPIKIDVSVKEDREKVVLHRLFENAENIDANKVEKIVEKYISAYHDPIKIEDTHKYKRRMERIYPFHPLLIDVLFNIYEAATERQNIRGMLNVLADAVRETYDKKDLILLSDIDENAFRGIDLRLIQKYEFDLDRAKDIGFAREILKTILIFTLDEKSHGATESDILLSVFSPTQGHTLNAILMDLENIYGKLHYLHREGDVYLFKHDLNIYALLEKERSKITEGEVREKILEILKKDVFDNRVFVLGFDEIPDHSKLKIVVIPEFWGTGDELKTKLNEFYKGRQWQNTYILVLPEKRTIFSYEIIEKAKGLKSAENLMRQVRDEEGKLKKILQEERKNIADKIRDCYGYIVKWVERNGELVYRLINVSPDIDVIREKARGDQGLCADFIAEEVEDKPDGIRIEDLINNFKRYRRYPLILDDETIYTAIRNLHRDKRIVIQGERGNYYIDESPRSLQPSFVIIHPKYAIEIEKPEVSEKIGGEVPAGISETGEEIEFTVEKKERMTLPLTGNSPRVILSQVEARTSEKDEFDEISIRYRFRQKLSKQEIMKFIKQLPHHEESEIEAEVVLWREKDES